MNSFKEMLKTNLEKESESSLSKDRVKEIDEKISANIAKALFYMSHESKDTNEKKQILNRMLNINSLFKNDFDLEMKRLDEKEENEI